MLVFQDLSHGGFVMVEMGKQFDPTNPHPPEQIEINLANGVSPIQMRAVMEPHELREFIQDLITFAQTQGIE